MVNLAHMQYHLTHHEDVILVRLVRDTTKFEHVIMMAMHKTGTAVLS